MNATTEILVSSLRKNGWNVQIRPLRGEVPGEVVERYHWLPNDVLDTVTAIDTAAADDDRSWFVSSGELDSKSDSAFKWNQWELESIDAANNDEERIQTIRQFWNNHFPIVLSVRDGYRYIAVRQDGVVVGGEEPEFEETEVLALSLTEFASAIDSPIIAKYL